MFYCYKATCNKTGKSYIGMTGQTIAARFSSHKRDAHRGSENIFHRAIRKYGHEAFTVVEISRHRLRSEALEAEADQIKKQSTMAPRGYNMTPGGLGVLSMTPESKVKHRAAVTEKHKDPEFKAKHLKGIYKSMTPERKRKMSEAKRGLSMHPNAAKGIYEAKQTAEYRKIASKAAAKTWQQEGYREKWRASKKQKHIEKADRFPLRDDGIVFASTRDAANYMKKHGWEKAAPNNICLACNGKYKSSCGHKWTWIDGDKARMSGEILIES